MKFDYEIAVRKAKEIEELNNAKDIYIGIILAIEHIFVTKLHDKSKVASTGLEMMKIKSIKSLEELMA